MSVINLSGPDEVVKTLDGHPYARFSTGMAADVAGLTSAEGAVLWWGETAFGRLGHARGPAGAVARLIEAGREALGKVRWVNVPRPEGECELPERAWDFRWTTRLPARSLAHKVVQVTDEDTVGKLLDEAFPESSVRPGHPLVIGWHGVRLGGRLVAVAADRSSRPPGSNAEPTVGAIGGMAVHPDFRGQGLGASVCAALTARFVTAYGLSTLGVEPDNVTAQRMYASIGYADSLPLVGVIQ